MQIKDGDYFSYSWKPNLGPSSDPYWCRDRRCVARTDNHGDIVLIDTFNYWPFKEGKEDTNIFTHEGLSREYSKYIDVGRFDLEFICNLNDYEFVHEYTKDDYEGVVFVGYQCTKKWAKPKGSEVSNNMVLKKLIAERDSLVDEVQYKQSRIERLNEQIGEMTAVFSQELLANSIFKWEDLAGKELLIRVGKCPDDLGKGEHICVMGMDKSTGKCYVLVNELRRFTE